MTKTPDPRYDDACDMSMQSAVRKLGIQRLTENGPWLTGPCPNCGDFSKPDSDRFNINIEDKGFFCRHQCGFKGKGAIELAKQYLGVDFKKALEELCGPKPAKVDPELQEKRRKKREAEDKAQRNRSNKYRDDAIRFAVNIWKEAVYEPRHPEILAYFGIRGIPETAFDALPKCIRFHPNLEYGKSINGQWTTFHTGPAFVTAIQSRDNKIRAIHRTWIDLSHPKGKAVISYEGHSYPAKTMLGSKKGGAIRLFTPRGTDTFVMGEGIETTLTAWAAKPFESAAYWAGADLGNMAGKMANARKRDGLPNMNDDKAFVPPPWVKRLVLIQDGDSDPKLTRAQLMSCINRARAHNPDLRGFIVHAGEGQDLNDIVMPKADDQANHKNEVEHDGRAEQGSR